jgi:hypothetical protein
LYWSVIYYSLKTLHLKLIGYSPGNVGHGRHSSQQTIGGLVVQYKTQQQRLASALSGALSTVNPIINASTANRSAKTLSFLKTFIQYLLLSKTFIDFCINNGTSPFSSS